MMLMVNVKNPITLCFNYNNLRKPVFYTCKRGVFWS